MPNNETPGVDCAANTSVGCWRFVVRSRGARRARRRLRRARGRWTICRRPVGEGGQDDTGLRSGIALVALGGYGRSELFPYSDVDLMYLLDGKVAEQEVKQPIRRISQGWDYGIRLSPLTRKRSEAERFDPDNVEFALASLDHRLLAGEPRCTSGSPGRVCRRCWSGSSKAIAAGWCELTAERHKKTAIRCFTWSRASRIVRAVCGMCTYVRG